MRGGLKVRLRKAKKPIRRVEYVTRQHAGKQQERLPREQNHFILSPDSASVLALPLQSIMVSELAKSRGKLTNKVYRKKVIFGDKVITCLSSSFFF